MTQVKFRDDFSPHLQGMVFDVIDGMKETPEGQRYVAIEVSGNPKQSRLAWVDDLRNLDGTPLDPANL